MSAKPVQTSVRLEPGQKEKLEEIARATGVDPSQLIRWAVQAIIKYAEKNEGRLLLPLDFGEKLVVVEKKPARTGSTVSYESGAEEIAASRLNAEPEPPKRKPVRYGGSRKAP